MPSPIGSPRSLALNERKMQSIRLMLREYLLYDGFPGLLQNFEDELRHRNVILPPLTRVDEAGLSEAVDLFDNGDRATFFEVWNELLDVEYKKSFDYSVERFWLEIYFAIYPKLTATHCNTTGTPATNRMQDFRSFLQQSGADVAERSAEFIPLFFLPYARDPSKHTLFVRFFQASWVDQLREKITTISRVHGKPPIPSIFSLMDSRQTTSLPPSTETVITKSRNTELSATSVFHSEYGTSSENAGTRSTVPGAYPSAPNQPSSRAHTDSSAAPVAVSLFQSEAAAISDVQYSPVVPTTPPTPSSFQSENPDVLLVAQIIEDALTSSLSTPIVTLSSSSPESESSE
ncbi:hypothetical protein SeLEV6574_g07570, partial [Synchytrium endobioticum]